MCDSRKHVQGSGVEVRLTGLRPVFYCKVFSLIHQPSGVSELRIEQGHAGHEYDCTWQLIRRCNHAPNRTHLHIYAYVYMRIHTVVFDNEQQTNARRIKARTSRCPAPLSKRRSLRMVSIVLRMAELALKISSRKAIEAVGKNPVVQRRYSSCYERHIRYKTETPPSHRRSRPSARTPSHACTTCSSARSESGPKISSGVVKRVSRRWKKAPPHKCARRCPRADLPAPGV